MLQCDSGCTIGLKHKECTIPLGESKHITYACYKGRKTGRPRVTDRPGFLRRYKTILEQLNAGEISRRGAARELDIGYATFKRMLDKKGAYHEL
jgi:DNA invertase Pin-like site-specific DNA recombinase